MMEQEPMLRDKCLHSEYKPPPSTAALTRLLKASQLPASASASARASIALFSIAPPRR